MKLLIANYTSIVENWHEQKNTTEKDLADALHQYTTAVVKKDELLSNDSARNHCKSTCRTTMFENITGSFCCKCGFVYPF